jgi:hypothetical protein
MDCVPYHMSFLYSQISWRRVWRHFFGRCHHAPRPRRGGGDFSRQNILKMARNQLTTVQSRRSFFSTLYSLCTVATNKTWLWLIVKNYTVNKYCWNLHKKYCLYTICCTLYTYIYYQVFFLVKQSKSWFFLDQLYMNSQRPNYTLTSKYIRSDPFYILFYDNILIDMKCK